MKDLLSAREAPINKILCADYTLIVPEYQRPYAWTTDEAETLLDDLPAPSGKAPSFRWGMEATTCPSKRGIELAYFADEDCYQALCACHLSQL